MPSKGPTLRSPEGQHVGVHFRNIWGFPKIRGTILGVPIIRTIVFGGLHWGPLILEKYHFVGSSCGLLMCFRDRHEQ